MRPTLRRAEEDGEELFRLPRFGQRVLGRDGSADLIFDLPEISRRHARIAGGPLGRWLEDLESSNGTRVNGEPVSGPVRLRSGDRIELGGELALDYLDSSTGLAWLLGSVMTLGVGLVIAWLALPGVQGPESQGTEAGVSLAANLVQEAVSAARRGNPVRARSRLRAAVSQLYRSGQLSQTGETGLDAAIELLQPRLGPEIDVRQVFQEAFEIHPPPVQRPEGEDLAGCRLDRAPVNRLKACLRVRVDQVLVELHQDPSEVPDAFYARVGSVLSREQRFLENALERGQPIVPMLREDLAAAHMPEILHYLALIESGYRPGAKSGAGAVGLWQLMPGTARHYGLRVGADRDERLDPRKSTRAAARYLRDLTFEFGGDALLLALASYNRGENGVRRALKKLENPFSDRSLWALLEQDLLPGETANYVPRFVAAAVAGEGGLPEPDRLVAAGY